MNLQTGLWGLVFPSSLFVVVVSLSSLISLGIHGIQELRGKHAQYSKLINLEPIIKGETKSIQSKLGMLVVYSPAFLSAAASFLIFPDEGLRFLLLRLGLTVHFLKRVLEVLFVHKYSGCMALHTLLATSGSYVLFVVSSIYSLHQSRDLPEPSTDLKSAGVILFSLGIGGNFYHHYILSTLRRRGGENHYRIPKGGMFSLVICPHYFFEAVEFLGLSFIAQTLYAFSLAWGLTFYLMCRGHATRQWYASKFEDFPKHVKVMIPFFF